MDGAFLCQHTARLTPSLVNSASLSANLFVSKRHLCCCRNVPHRLCLSTERLTFLCTATDVEVGKQNLGCISARTFFSPNIIELNGICKNSVYPDSLPFKRCFTELTSRRRMEGGGGEVGNGAGKFEWKHNAQQDSYYL